MIEATQKKLREAQFFLAHLERVAFTHASESNEAVAFYLSAFLSAARSVTFSLEAEEPNRYANWSAAWRSTLSEDDRKLLADFTSARNRALKRETPAILEDHIASAKLDPYAGLPPALRFADDDEEEQTLVANRVFVGRLIPERPKEEVIPLCRQYAELLSKAVTNFLLIHAA